MDTPTILALYKRGLTHAEIAERAGTTRHAVTQRLHGAGVRQWTFIDPEEAALCRTQYEAGASLAELADGAGVAVDTIRRRVLLAGGTMRAPGRRRRNER